LPIAVSPNCQMPKCHSLFRPIANRCFAHVPASSVCICKGLQELSDSFTQQHSANTAKQWYACIVQEIQNIIVSCGQEIQKSRLRFLIIHRLKRNLNTKDCVSHTSGVRLPPFFSASSSPFNSAHTSFLSCLQQEQTGKCNLYSRDCVSNMFINSILFMHLSIWAQLETKESKFLRNQLERARECPFPVFECTVFLGTFVHKNGSSRE
jgi:hypothetical protein